MKKSTIEAADKEEAMPHRQAANADSSCMTLTSVHFEAGHPFLEATATDCDSTTSGSPSAPLPAPLQLLPMPPPPPPVAGAAATRKRIACNNESGTSSDSASDSIEATYVHSHSVTDDDDSSRCRRRRRKTRRRSSIGEEESPESRDEDEDMANCLVMLASDAMLVKKAPLPSSCEANNTKHDFYYTTNDLETSKKQQQLQQQQIQEQQQPRYSCATCKRVFKSHQALGGHRASHKRVKGCFARTSSTSSTTTLMSSLDEEEDVVDEHEPSPFTVMKLLHTPPPAVKKPVLALSTSSHECSVCHRVFPTGQALGGHKRCHWGGGGGGGVQPLHGRLLPPPPLHFVAPLLPPSPRAALFDLNLPPPQDEISLADMSASWSHDTTFTSNLTDGK